MLQGVVEPVLGVDLSPIGFVDLSANASGASIGSHYVIDGVAIAANGFAPPDKHRLFGLLGLWTGVWACGTFRPVCNALYMFVDDDVRGSNILASPLNLFDVRRGCGRVVRQLFWRRCARRRCPCGLRRVDH